MNNKHRYFDSAGREVEEHIALDRDVLRSGYSMRTPMTLRDARHSAGKANRITDGQGNGGLALNRPGYRIPTVQDRASVHDAYAKADRRANHSWKCRDDETLCPDCDGEGYIDGVLCDTCDGDGVIDDFEDSTSKGGSRIGSNNEGGDPNPASDHRTVDARRRLVEDSYSQYDADLAQAYRRG